MFSNLVFPVGSSQAFLTPNIQRSCVNCQKTPRALRVYRHFDESSSPTSAEKRAGVRTTRRMIALIIPIRKAYCLYSFLRALGNKENVDHVVLGPTGIFAIETKDYRGKITCKGSYWAVPFPYGRSSSGQAKGNAYWVKKTIDGSGVSETLKVALYVKPIAVFSNPDVELITIDPEVDVVKLDELAESITAYSRYDFSIEQLKAMGNAITTQAQNT